LSKKHTQLVRIPGSAIVSGTSPQRYEGQYPKSEEVSILSARYAYLATWCSCAGWRRATQEWIVRLAWSEIFRSEDSKVLWDSRDRRGIVGCGVGSGYSSVFDED
jgi:hypothetical protein